MPTILLRTAIPDYPNNGQEICHLFSANYLLSRANGVVNYKMPQNGVDSINFLFNVIHRFNLQRTNGPIQPGDLIIIGNRNMNANANTAIANVTHSMIAIDNNIWFGCNNTNTFGLYFAQLHIPANSLFSRREINMAVLPVNINYNNRTFGDLSFDVFH